mgnify:CR=1 FL=1
MKLLRPRRREFLSGIGAAGAAGLAGCVSLGEETDERNDGTAAVVSDHHLATEAGVGALEDGGTAADAAVAVASVLSVVQPWFSSVLGGGTWALYYDAESDEVTSLDGVGPIGSEATLRDYVDRGGSEGLGMYQAIVPGAWDGWMLWLDRYGSLDLGEVLAPATEIARDGYSVTAEMDYWLHRPSLRRAIGNRPHASAIYKPEGELLEEGDTVYQRDMADTFDSLVEAYDERKDEGRKEAIQAARDHYYRGPIAEKIVEFSDRRGGYLTLSDFREFEAEILDPISIEYGDRHRVYQNPPNSQGITMLLILNILDGYDLSEMDPDGADAVHLQTEATKLAFADRYHHVGDPDRVDVPVEELLEKDYAANQRDRIEMNDTLTWPIESGLEPISSDTDADHTTTFHIVDNDGNAAAVTTSLGAEFLVVGETGIHINNRMRMISTEEGNPNRLTPGYKVRHTSNPYMSFRDGSLHIVGGNTGVDTQPQGQSQEFLSVVEFGFDAQKAVSRPRFVSTGFPSGTSGEVRGRLQMESEFPDTTVEELEKRGHEIELDEGIFGSANMIVLEDESGDEGTIQVGAEPRVSTSEGRTVAPEGE